MTALITGATKGIGYAIADKFASHGFDLIVCARSGNDLQDVKAEWEEKFGIRVYAFQVDLSSAAETRIFIGSLLKEAPQPEVLINNAGSYIEGDLFSLDASEELEMLQLNFLAAHNITKALIPGFHKRGSGHVFNIASYVANETRARAAFYSISKQAMRTWSKLLFHEMRPFGIKVTAVLPASTYTNSWKDSGISPEKLTSARQVSELIWQCYSVEAASVVEEIVVRTMNEKLG